MAEHEAASLSPTDVQAAVNLCAEGDTVVLPAGDYSGFNTTVEIPNGISMRGQGVASTIMRHTNASTIQMLRWNSANQASSYSVEIKNFTLYGMGTSGYSDSGIGLYNGMVNFKVHDIDFHGQGHSGIWAKDYGTKGVIYSCNFYDIYANGLGYSVRVDRRKSTDTYYGDQSWTDPIVWGSDAFVFIEDCYFNNGRASIDGHEGARWVARHNTFEAGYTNLAYNSSHGRVPYNSGNRGVRAVECYENSFIHSPHYTNGVEVMSGEWLIWNDTFTGPWPTSPAGYCIWLDAADGDGRTYPISDQMRASYVWGNSRNGTPFSSWASPNLVNGCPDLILQNRDVYFTSLSGYTPYTYPHPLRGEAPPADPEINIQYNSINIPDGNTYNFGFKGINSNTDQIFTLGNIGDGDLTLSGTPIITITGDNADQFSVQAQPSTPIAGFSNTTFTLRFTPTSLGLKTAAISIVNNDADENPYDIVLNGTGVEGIYYVDQTDGNDSWDGLAPEYVSGTNGPWKTIAQVNGSSFLAGDTVLFQCGETWREQLTVPDSGSDGSPITFGAYGTGAKPKIYGSTQISTWSDEGSNIWYATCAADPMSVWFVNTDDSIVWGTKCAAKVDVTEEYEWWWDDPNDRLYVYAATDPDTRYTSVEGAVRLNCIRQYKDYITIDGLDLRFSQNYGIRCSYDPHPNYCTIQNNEISYIGVMFAALADGIILGGNAHVARNNTIHDAGTHGIFLLSNLTTYNTTNNIVEDNTIFDCYHSCIDMQTTISNGTNSGHIIRRNLIYTTPNYAKPSLGCSGILIGSDAELRVIDDVEISDNIIFNIWSQGIGCYGYVTNTNFYNNTIYGTNPLNTTLYTAGIHIGGPGISGINIKNNVVMDIYSGAGGGDRCLYISDSSQIFSCDNNLWYQSSGGTRMYTGVDSINYHYDDFAAYKTATGWDTNGLWEDPLMTDPANGDFTLQATSPCINAGVDVGLTTDYAGNPIVGLPDIGAYEYPGGAVTAVTIFFGCNF